jgi:hypothetical protein
VTNICRRETAGEADVRREWPRSRRGRCQHHCTTITSNAPRTTFKISRIALEALTALKARYDYLGNISRFFRLGDSIICNHLLDRGGPYDSIRPFGDLATTHCGGLHSSESIQLSSRSRSRSQHIPSAYSVEQLSFLIFLAHSRAAP